MKKITIFAASLLLIFSIIGLSTVLSGVTVTLESKGRPETIIKSDGTWSITCLAVPDSTCSIKILMPKD